MDDLNFQQIHVVLSVFIKNYFDNYLCLIPIMKWPFVLDSHEKDIGGTKITEVFFTSNHVF